MTAEGSDQCTGGGPGDQCTGGGRVDWFVRRVGLARTATFLCAGGLAAAAIGGARPLAAGISLTVALIGVLAGLTISALFARRKAVDQQSRCAHISCLTVISVLLVGFCAGHLGGSVRVMALTDGELVRHVGDRIRVEMIVTGQVRSHSGWQNATARLVEGTITSRSGVESGSSRPAPAGETVLVEVSPPAVEPSPLLIEGAIIACQGKICEPEGPTESGFNQKAYLRRQGIEVVVSAAAADVQVLGSRGGVAGWVDRIRARAKADLSHGPDARLDEVLQGVVMGDTVGIDSSWLDAFRRAGTAHMLSVSGLHVASLAAIMIGLARLARLRRSTGFILAALAALSMIPFTGASPPVIRAAVMIVIVLAGSWVGRRRDQWQVLALAAMVVLALNPFALFDAGFQLSFGAFVGIVALVAPLQRRLHILPAAVASNLAVSLAASLGTAPISLAIFGQTSLVGALSNLLVIPVLPVITGLGMASVVAGYIWDGLSAALDTLAAPATAWTVQVSRLFALAPVVSSDNLGRVVLGLAGILVVLPAVLSLSGRTVRVPFGLSPPLYRRVLRCARVLRARSRGLAVTLAVGLVLCAVCAGVIAYVPLAQGMRSAVAAVADRGWPDQVEIRILNIGQGSATLVRTPDRHALLFDGGPSGCRLGHELAALGVRRLDVVVISHPHADHFAGLLECLDQVEIGLLIDGTEVTEETEAADGTKTADGVSEGERTAVARGKEAQDYLDLRRRLVGGGARYLTARTGSTVEAGGLTVEFFAPVRPLKMVDGLAPWGSRGAVPDGDELNGSSVVALLRYGQVEVLLPGDAEAEVLRRYALPPVDVLVVPHHGSRGAVSGPLLKGAGVKSAVVSVGAGNSFGHPDAGTLELLRENVGAPLRTDQVGWVCYSTDGKDLTVTTQR